MLKDSCYPNEIAEQKLFNTFDREYLKALRAKESFQRVTLSFYRYTNITDPQDLRDQLYQKSVKLGTLGRIYLAEEGVNGQVSVPEPRLAEFSQLIASIFANIPLKLAVEDQPESFLKLVIKVKQKILADGQDDGSYDVTNVGRHLTASEFNQATDHPDAVIVDVRNAYESEVGHFKGALLPDVDRFADELPVIKSMLEGQQDKKILLYCTGGIRCEKTSAWLKHHGYKDVNQLHGGVIDYVRQVKEQNLENKFIGKNFVFDGRLGERVSEDVIAHCHVCGTSADNQDNCQWQACHTLYIFCKDCHSRLQGCCSQECLDNLKAPADKRSQLQSAPKPPMAAKRNLKKVVPNLKP